MIKYLLLINMIILPVCFGHDSDDPTIRQLTIKNSFRAKMREITKNYVDFRTKKEIFKIDHKRVLLNPSKVDIERLKKDFIQELRALTPKNQFTAYYKESLKTIKRYFSQIDSLLSLDQINDSILPSLMKISSNIDICSNIFLTEMGVNNVKIYGWDFYNDLTKFPFNYLSLEPKHKNFLQWFSKKISSI